MLKDLCPDGPIHSVYPVSFEEIGQDYGFVLYSTIILSSSSGGEVLLDLSTVRDHAHVFINKVKFILV